MIAPRETRRGRHYCTQFREEKERADREHEQNPGATSTGKEAGQKLARFAKKALVKHRVVGGSFGTYIESSCASGNMRGKTGGRLNAAGSADSDEDGTFIERLKICSSSKGVSPNQQMCGRILPPQEQRGISPGDS